MRSKGTSAKKMTKLKGSGGHASESRIPHKNASRISCFLLLFSVHNNDKFTFYFIRICFEKFLQFLKCTVNCIFIDLCKLTRNRCFSFRAKIFNKLAQRL